MDAGRYEILGLLGKGGCGTVYRARFLGEGGFQKEVALKVLHVEDDDEMARRLRDEARILALLHHRAIVKVDRLVRLDGRWTVVMELVRGVDLRKLVEGGPLAMGPALEIIAEVASALQVAWAATGPDGRPLHLVHRDIKPSNLLLTPFGEMKVLDFGIARAEFNSREAETQAVAFGSLEYMSPERLDFFENVPGPEGDIYGLGLVLYELLTARAFGRTSPMRKKHDERLNESMGHIRERFGAASEPVIELCARLLAFEELERPDAREVERQCRTLRNRMEPDESLRDAAERLVPELLIASEAQDDADVGRILEERTDSHRGGFSALTAMHGAPPLPPVLEDEEPTNLLTIGRDLHLPTPEDETALVDEAYENEETPRSTPRVRPVVEDRRWQAPEIAAPVPHPGPLPAAPPAPPPEPDRSPWLVFAVGLAGMLVLGILGVVIFLARRGAEVEAPAPAPVAAPVQAPAPPPSPPPVTPPVSTPPVSNPTVSTPPASTTPTTPHKTHTGSTTVVSAPVETPKPPEPKAVESAPTGTGDATVNVSGDVEYATLEGTAGFFYVPGPVPPGHYLISANFSGESVGAGAITLKAGEKVTLKCTAADTSCDR